MGANNPIKPIIFFDGICNLCNQSVLFVIKRDKKARFNFAPLQSEYAKHYLQQYDHLPEMNTILLLKDNRLYKKSSAVLTIAQDLTGLWPLLYVFMIVPAFVRNAVYDWVSRHRYRWFGKKEECMIPTPELQNRFIN